jgi:nucleoside-diphosphate-sugar epimerase
VVVTGATGNVGSALVERLAAEPAVDEVVGVARRPHDWRPDKTTWSFLDVATDDLGPLLDGADAVVHLAWVFHPTRHPDQTWAVNVSGTDRLLRAAASVPALVVASSVGAYSPRRDLSPVDESYPTHGVPTAAYSREKAFVERLLDIHEAAHPDQRVVRFRPGFIFWQRAATQQRRIFLGPLVPGRLLRPGTLPVVPLPRGLHLPVLHTEDAADAYATAVLRPVTGAFNLAADPPLAPDDLAELLGARRVEVPPRLAHAALAAAFAAHAVPVEPGLLDLAMVVPMLDSSRARAELSWRPRHTPAEALQAFLSGVSGESGHPTPPLAEETSGPLRSHEVATGLGAREG